MKFFQYFLIKKWSKILEQKYNILNKVFVLYPLMDEIEESFEYIFFEPLEKLKQKLDESLLSLVYSIFKN